MALKFEKGASVQIINTVLVGTVVGAKFSAEGEDSMTVLFRVRFVDTEGVVQERHFAEDQLQSTTG